MSVSGLRIRRDYFDVAPNQNSNMYHSPDDDTHSVILEVVEKRLWKLHAIDPASTDILDLLLQSRWVFGVLALIASIAGFAKSLLSYAAGSSQEHHWMLIYAAIAGVCAVCLVWTWLRKRLCIQKAIKNKNYTCRIQPMDDLHGHLDGILEVKETNAPGNFVRLVVDCKHNPRDGYNNVMVIVDLCVKKAKLPMR